MDSDNQETLRKDDEATNKILEAISNLHQEVVDLRQETRQQINDLRQEMTQQIRDLRREMNERFAKIETEIEEIKHVQFSFDVRLDRLQAMAYDALNIGHDLKADVKILTAEIRAWAADVSDLQQKVV